MVLFVQAMETSRHSDRLARFVWLTLGVNLVVILWGAWVRASGSGAGCGNHWPTCQGVVIPRAPSAETLIEFVHRATSGVALVLALLVLWLVWRRFPARHWARKGAVATVVLMCVEAGLGAGLVKFALVARNASVTRAVSLGAHLVNTQLLLGAIALTAWWAAGGAPPAVRRLGRRGWWFALAGLGLLAVGMTGAIASLGDTLFPSRTLAEGMAQDFDATAHLLLRLRVWHPVLAVLVGSGLLILAAAAARWRPVPDVTAAGRRVIVMVLLQWTLGVTSLVLLAPVPLQLLHLLSADLLWLTAVLLAAASFAAQPGRTTEESSLAASASNTPPAPASR
jgi:heme A synthase